MSNEKRISDALEKCGPILNKEYSIEMLDQMMSKLRHLKEKVKEGTKPQMAFNSFRNIVPLYFSNVGAPSDMRQVGPIITEILIAEHPMKTEKNVFSAYKEQIKKLDEILAVVKSESIFTMLINCMKTAIEQEITEIVAPSDELLKTFRDIVLNLAFGVGLESELLPGNENIMKLWGHTIEFKVGDSLIDERDSIE